MRPDPLQSQLFSPLHNYVLFHTLCTAHVKTKRTPHVADQFCHGIWRETISQSNAIVTLLDKNDRDWTHYTSILDQAKPRQYDITAYRSTVRSMYDRLLAADLPPVAIPKDNRELFMKICLRNVQHLSRDTAYNEARRFCTNAWYSDQQSTYVQQLDQLRRPRTRLDQFFEN